MGDRRARRGQNDSRVTRLRRRWSRAAAISVLFFSFYSESAGGALPPSIGSFIICPTPIREVDSALATALELQVSMGGVIISFRVRTAIQIKGLDLAFRAGVVPAWELLTAAVSRVMGPAAQ
ncbi:hypothetical protein EVAR_82160_1 [Eumeta japonica]|uniref:Uncharacterized protein n=1 Tax=Eumeta variegata TaxID=151549 RepID=A0A4C1U377_EUMVA|nr:hypothetical protein EVAR_82160_1 [Eumeta japonica]